MFKSLRTFLSRFSRPSTTSAPAAAVDAADARLLEAPTKPIAVVAEPELLLLDDDLEHVDWGDDFEEDAADTEQMSEQQARQVLLQAGFDVERPVSRRGLGVAVGGPKAVYTSPFVVGAA